MRESKLSRLGKFLLLAVMMFFVLFPIYWQFVMSVSDASVVNSGTLSWLIPKSITLEHYKTLFERSDFMQFFWSSLIVAGVTTIVTLAVSTLGGYALGRIRFKKKRLVGRLILFTYIVPSVLLLIPLFTMIVTMGVQNTKFSLIMAHMTFALPFCLWMLRGFFSSLPAGLEEAAMIDGCSTFQAFRRVMLPLAAPGMVAAAMFTFMLSWNEYLFAMVFTTNNAGQTLPVGIVSNFYNTIMTPQDWCTIMAAAVLVSLPVYFLFLVLQKYLVQGLAAGSVKE